MSRWINHVPKYRKAANGQAFIYHRSIASRDHRAYLGKHGSEESVRRYRQMLRRLELNQTAQALPEADATATVYEVAALYDEFAKGHYKRDRGMSPEYDGMWSALRILAAEHGYDLAEDFGPRAFKALQRLMAADDYARSHVNHTTNRIKRFFRWACEEEIIEPAIYQRLLCVRGLRCGEFGVRDAAAVKPATIEMVQRLLPYVSPVVGAMMQVQYFCAMRPAEVCMMRPFDIEQTGDVWIYTPQTHKNQWRGKDLLKAVPVVAQEILSGFIQGCGESDYLFSPRESSAWARAQAALKRTPRKTKRFPCEARRVEKEKLAQQARRKAKAPGECYATGSYRQAIRYGITKAAANGVGIPLFTPNQLRHGILTFIAKAFGQQRAQRYAGHEHLSTTSIYTEIGVDEMMNVARQIDAHCAKSS